ncbi:nucleotide-diphospho-sugar transferase [Meredithblackwellia eburnea MCA 4105]
MTSQDHIQWPRASSDVRGAMKKPRLRWTLIVAWSLVIHALFLLRYAVHAYRGHHPFSTSTASTASSVRSLPRRTFELVEQHIHAPNLLYHTSAPPIHLVFTTSASYTIGLVALINSTLISAEPQTKPRLQFHIISSDLAEARHVVRMMTDMFKDVNERRFIPYGLKESRDGRLDHVKVWAGYRSESLSKPIVFARYLIPDLLPATVERAIYLDQDTLVVKDLAPLWDIDMDGKPIAAARLCRPTALFRHQFIMKKDPLKNGGFDHDTCTLNNGVLVYDMKSWRASSPSFSNQLFEWTRLNNLDRLYSLGSQPPFNLVFYRNYKILDDRWNLMDIAGLKEDTTYGHGLPWTRTRDEVSSAAVIHWNGEIKPWMCGGEGYYSELWTYFFPNYREYLGNEEIPETMCKSLVVTNPPQPPSVEQFTVVIVSFMRVDTIVKIAKHLQRSLYVKEIVVAWNNVFKPCPEELSELPWVRCIQQEANLVHNRFLIWPNITTEAVLHYDDDVIAPLEDLEAAFSLWKEHRDQILGFEPRVIVCDSAEVDLELQPSAGARIPKGCRYRFQLKQGVFDIVIGKLFFVAKSFMQVYTETPELMELSLDAPCEDIAMSFVTGLLPLPPDSPIHSYNQFPRPPLLFKSNLTEIKSKKFSGLSQGIASGIWRDKRHGCVDALLQIFKGRTPGGQESYYELDPVRRRLYKLPVAGRLDKGWCSDTHGSRECRQP